MPTHPSQHPHFRYFHLLDMGVFDWPILCPIQHSQSNHCLVELTLKSQRHILITQDTGSKPPLHPLRYAKDFRIVQTEVAELIKGRILVGHALRNDFKALLLNHPKQDIRDTSEFQHFLREGRSRALRHLATEVLGVEIQNGEHCPIEDARAAMMLYLKRRKEWEKSVKDFVRLKEKQKKRKPKKKTGVLRRPASE
ncbi:hypothetical protein A4A49_14550 [Nicotiana attenuata]|uniref:Exonuclease domain-containing protein n=1 Tax=Nicotiana attenuata TaxID=49451 RepID=A0A1J6I9S0_NICAT|nr:hypothetical protein A4A49_14550 [Nicotiana attenuata]